MSVTSNQHGFVVPSPEGAAVAAAVRLAAPITVSIVDDDLSLVDLVRRKLKRLPDLSFLASYPSAEDVFRLLPGQVPDVLLVDLILPKVDGIAVVGWITRRFPGVQMIVVSGCDDPNHVVQALEAGARGYLVKPLSLADLPAAIRNVAAGRTIFAPAISDFVVSYFNRKGLVGDAVNQLTARERQVVAESSNGDCDKTIADRLGISPNTYRNHLQNIYRKLEVSSKREALAKLKGSHD